MELQPWKFATWVNELSILHVEYKIFMMNMSWRNEGSAATAVATQQRYFTLFFASYLKSAPYITFMSQFLWQYS